MTSKHPLRPVFVLLALTPFAACGGGASSGTSSVTVGLEGPGQVSVVTAETGGTAPAGGIAPGASNFAADSDYVTDGAQVWVYDPSMEALETVNSILTQTSATAYGQMVNYGPYVAQIAIEEDKSSAGSDTKGQSAGAQGDEFEFFTVDSQRASNSQPQTVQFWVPETMDDSGPGSSSLIYAEMTIDEGATDIDPFGDFRLNFALADAPANLGTPFMFGTLSTTTVGAGELGFQFYSESGDVTQPVGPGEFADKIQVNVTMAADQTTGVAKILQQMRWYDDWLGADSGLMTESWQVAFNDTHFKRQADGGAITTLSRSDFTNNVWNYNLYYASGANAGQRVDLNSGFGFTLPGGEYGWIGYYGFWVPDGVTLTNGQTITEEVWDDSIPKTYTVVKAPGKLLRHSKNQMDLVDIGSTTFQYWDPTDGFQYMVSYHDALFWKTSKWDDISGTWQALPSEVSIDLVSLGGWLNMWSDTLGGNVTYLEGGTYITYYSEEFVNPASTAFDGLVGDRLELFGFIDCLKPNMTAADVEAGDIYLPNVEVVASPLVYRFDKSDMTLYYDAAGDDSNSQPVGLASGQVPTDGPYMWGMQSGPMVTDTTGIVNPWDVWDLTEFYTYETGHNEWNQYGAVVDSLGAPVVFDAPLQFLYTHSTANDRNADTTYDGEAYYLEYNGPGDLWGIPSEGVDLNGDSEPDRWYPLFSLADGVPVGPTGTEYVVRGIEMEQTMSEAPGAAPTLDVTAADSLVLPTAADYTMPNNGAEPTVTDPPAVVDGEVQAPAN